MTAIERSRLQQEVRMGAVKTFLAEKVLGDRELHNSRLFIDLCENIHIHYREFRLIFSLDEYFEFVDIIGSSTRDVRNYLSANPDYREGSFPTTLMVACGPDRQKKFLQNSPQPHESAYHNHRFAIELQEECITDEVHVHWRDLRVALSRENFKDVARAFADALQNLTEFEALHHYQRRAHYDREVKHLNNAVLDGESVQGVERLRLDQIASYWFEDIEALKTNWRRNEAYIAALKARFINHEPVPPLLVTRPDLSGTHHLVNGHHRLLAAHEAGLESIDVVVVPMDFAETEDLRNAELSLKSFDEKTNHQYGLTSFLNDYVAFKFNRHYINDFRQHCQQSEREAAPKSISRWRQFTRRVRDGIRRIGKRPTETGPAPLNLEIPTAA